MITVALMIMAGSSSAQPGADACSRLEVSQGGSAPLGARIDLAMCYERAGKFAHAWAMYRESIELEGTLSCPATASDVGVGDRAQGSR